jgi:hypothetical protein
MGVKNYWKWWRVWETISPDQSSEKVAALENLVPVFHGVPDEKIL